MSRLVIGWILQIIAILLMCLAVLAALHSNWLIAAVDLAMAMISSERGRRLRREGQRERDR